jgi:hypothetical protein
MVSVSVEPGAVNNPVLEMVPVPLTIFHVGARTIAPEYAVNCAVEFSDMVAVPG